jgi:hypothetical protein
MEIVVALLAGALLASLLTNAGAAAMLVYVRNELAVERRVREDAQARGLQTLAAAEYRHAEAFGRLLAETAAERHTLLERIQRPHAEPYTELRRDDDERDEPLPWISEDEEIAKEREARAAEIQARLDAAERALEVPAEVA